MLWYTCGHLAYLELSVPEKGHSECYSIKKMKWKPEKGIIPACSSSGSCGRSIQGGHGRGRCLVSSLGPGPLEVLGRICSWLLSSCGEKKNLRVWGQWKKVVSSLLFGVTWRTLRVSGSCLWVIEGWQHDAEKQIGAAAAVLCGTGLWR